MTDDIITFSSENSGILTSQCLPVDREPEILSLRPERLSEYIGQETVVETLKIAIEAALKRGEPLDHVIFHGPPGLGKTTLAHIIANEMGVDLPLPPGLPLKKAVISSAF